MKRRIFPVIGLAGLLILSGCEKEMPQSELAATPENVVMNDLKSGDIIPGQFVVIMNESNLKLLEADGLNYEARNLKVKEVGEALLKKSNVKEFEIINAYSQTLKGFSVKMSEVDAAKLERQNDVKYLVPDRMYIMRPPWENPDPTPVTGEQTPYGITRVGTANGTGKVAWIIDTGIDLDHPDLTVDVARGKNFISTTKTADDDNGHGSHCAGIVAAIDNEIGVVGVAAGATVVPVKVLDRRGSGAYSVILAGVDYVASAASPGDAANMSLGGGIYQPIDDAVIAAAAKGIFFSLAAGNESTDANNSSPARANGANIFTISAMDVNDNFAYFSNYGNPPVDFCEPGVSIYSTYKGGGYTTMSGTSMAAPHMCGILLITGGKPATDGFVNGDPDGNPDPIGVL